MKVHVFVNSIVKTTTPERVIVEASNGSPEGPPFVRFEVARPYDQVIGKRYSLTIEEAD